MHRTATPGRRSPVDVYKRQLQYGEDYTVTWYVCTDEVTWQLLGTGETMEVKPEKNTDQYKAVAMPAGDYKKPVDGVIFLTTKGELVVTKMELTREPTGTVYVGNTVTVTATVQQAADEMCIRDSSTAALSV